MRKYQPIWEAIKANSTASLAADPSAHQLIIKEVIREKYKDRGWRLLCQEENKKYRLVPKSKGSLLTFTLKSITPPVALSSL